LRIIAAAGLLSLLLPLNALVNSEVPTHEFSMEDVQCLALNIYYEARGEPLAGQKAVAHVTLNRLADGRFRDTLCGVVKQPGQFSWVPNFPNFQKAFKTLPFETVILATEILSGKYIDNTKGALYFHANYVEPFKRKRTVIIGNHIFYQ